MCAAGRPKFEDRSEAQSIRFLADGRISFAALTVWDGHTNQVLVRPKRPKPKAATFELKHVRVHALH